MSICCKAGGDRTSRQHLAFRATTTTTTGTSRHVQLQQQMLMLIHYMSSYSMNCRVLDSYLVYWKTSNFLYFKLLFICTTKSLAMHTFVWLQI